MGPKRLTAAFCDSVKPEAGRQLSFPDADVPGLELRVSGEGRKVWSYRYRTERGRRGRVTLGIHSDAFGLSDARMAARRAQVEVDRGGDPGLTRRLARIEAAAEPLATFGDLAAAYFSDTEAGRYRPKRASSLNLEKSVYRVHIQRALARVPLECINRRLIRSTLHRILDGGVTAQAVRAQAIIRQMLAYAVAEERLPFNCISDLAPVAPARARMRVYSDEELKAIWNGVQCPETLVLPKTVAANRRDGAVVQIGRPMRLAILLAFVLLQRRSEVLGMAKAELDLRHGLWTIPADRMKGKRTHVVPLSGWAIQLIQEAIEASEARDSPYVFPGKNKPGQPMRGPSMNWALNTVLWALGIEDGVVHDIRRTGSTLMTSERLGIAPFIRSKVLAHYDTGGGASVSTTRYDANSYIGEKRAALERWQDLLRRIVGEMSHAQQVRFDGVPQIAVAAGSVFYTPAPRSPAWGSSPSIVPILARS